MALVRTKFFNVTSLKRHSAESGTIEVCEKKVITDDATGEVDGERITGRWSISIEDALAEPTLTTPVTNYLNSCDNVSRKIKQYRTSSEK